MVNNLGIAILFCLLCNSLNSYAAPASEDDCTKKYGSSLFNQNQAIKQDCIRTCQNPEERQILITEAIFRVGVNETNYIKMCERAEDNDENNKHLEQCIAKYGGSFDSSTHEFDNNSLKNVCALSCHYPEVVQKFKKRTHLNETDHEKMCERAEDNEENNKNQKMLCQIW